MADSRKSGIVLFIALATVMVVIILAGIILSIMSNQSRLTHHEVSRIQAYYASLAGVNLAFDGLRTGAALWPMPAAGAFYDRFLCADASLCPGGAIIDPAIPASIESVRIRIAGRAVDGCNEPNGSQVCISARATYTFQP